MHTPEPWPVPDTAAFRWAREYEQLNAGSLSLADYLRAKACVDACAGMDDPEVAIKALRKELKLTTHKVLTCGVAASHPDAALSSNPKHYGGPWDSPQAQAVRALRTQRDDLASELSYLGDYFTGTGRDEIVQRIRKALAKVYA